MSGCFVTNSPGNTSSLTVLILGLNPGGMGEEYQYEELRRSHAQEALNCVVYVKDSNIQEHIKLLQTHKAEKLTYTHAIHTPMLNANIRLVSWIFGDYQRRTTNINNIPPRTSLSYPLHTYISNCRQ